MAFVRSRRTRKRGPEAPKEPEGPEGPEEPLPPFEAGLLGWLSRHGFEVPAILVAESIKPVAWILAQTVHFFTPHLDIASYLHPALREERVGELAAFLEDRERVNRFVDALEAEARRNARRRRSS